MIVNHISTAKLAKKNDICKFKCKMHTFLGKRSLLPISATLLLVNKQCDRKGRTVLILHSNQGLLLSLRTIIS